MNWRDNLREASFRGVQFHYLEAGGEGGRRIARHLYPLRDLPYQEDLGRKERSFTLRAFVLGETYHLQRDRLIKALEAKGPGILSHPYQGEVSVVCTSYRRTETTREGGMAAFSLTFEEAGGNVFPSARPDTAERLRGAATAASTAVEEAFSAAFTVEGVADRRADHGQDGRAERRAGQPAGKRAASPADGFALLLDGRATVRESGDRAAPAGEVLVELEAMQQQQRALLRTPSLLAGRVTSLLSRFASLSPLSGFVPPPFGLSLFGANLASIPAGTASRSRQAVNRAAIIDLIRRSGVIEAARQAAGGLFDSDRDALALRDTLFNALEDLIFAAGDAGDDPAFTALSNLQAAVTRDLTTRAADLTRLVSVTPLATVPALALAGRLYGDDLGAILGRAANIGARNKIRHPGFLTGGNELTVPANE